jgi:hypothetical protein
LIARFEAGTDGFGRKLIEVEDAGESGTIRCPTT